jgi:hypothetical protein
MTPEAVAALPTLLTIPQACDSGLLPFSRAVAYAAIRSGEFPLEVIRVGRKRLYVRKRDLLVLVGLIGGAS